MKEQQSKTVSNVARVGLMGGAFDPPHIGHLRLATEAVERLHLNEVRLIPVNIPPKIKYLFLSSFSPLKII